MSYTDYIDPGNSGGSVPTPDTYYPIITKVVEPVFECEICKITFENEKECSEHKYTIHPIKIPLIIIKGEQIGHAKKRIFEKLVPGDIKIENCTQVTVNNKDILTSAELVEILSNKNNGFFKLDLKNKDNSTTYEIEFSVADIASLDAIDKAFVTIFQRTDLTPQKINQFINEVKVHEGGKDYASAYVAYLYGVLAKEKNEEISTSYTDYLDKFNEAYDVLNYYPRSLSRSVCAIISFNNNFFEKTQELSNYLPSILNACVFIQNGILIDVISQNANNGKMIPIDWIMEKIIKLSTTSIIDLEQLSDYEKWLKSSSIPDKDKDKLIVILARKYKQAGEENKKTELLKSLRNNPDFDTIINNILDR